MPYGGVLSLRAARCQLKRSIFSVLLFWPLGFSVFAVSAETQPPPEYELVKVPTGSVIVDGMITEESWQNANAIEHMQYPWRSENAPETWFRAVWDEENLYFAFSAKDHDIVFADKYVNEESAIGEDRVEMFFATDAIDQPIHGPDTGCNLPLYYGLEIDGLGRVIDFSARYYRKFDIPWNMEGLETAAEHDKNGYRIEGKIPLQVLRDLNLLKDDNSPILVGVFRGEFTRNEGKVTQKWISWVDIQTPQPDFHISEAFGYFLLKK